MRKFIGFSTIATLALLFTVSAPKSYAAGAILSLSPNSQSVLTGESLSANVILDTGGEIVNRVLVKLNYSPGNTLTPQSIDWSNSQFDLLYQQDISTSGQITLEAATATGVSGSQLTFARINFTAAAAGTTTLTFSADSRVFRESDGSNILTTVQSAEYSVLTPTPTPLQTLAPTSTTTVSPTITTPPTLTPTLAVTLPPGTTPGALTPTPSILPNGGITSPTVIFVSVIVGLIAIGVFVLRKA